MTITPFTERDQDRRLDSWGQLKSENVDVTRMILVNGIRFEQLMEHNGQLPSAAGADNPFHADLHLHESIGATHTAAWLTTYLLFSQRKCGILPVGNQNGGAMKQKADVLQGTLALMVLKTLDVLGALHGYGIARRIEQISGDVLAVNQGTLYPVLLKLEQEGAIASEWGASENNRRARFYRLTREGRKQLQVETQDWEQTAAIIARFFEVKTEDLP